MVSDRGLPIAQGSSSAARRIHQSTGSRFHPCPPTCSPTNNTSHHHQVALAMVIRPLMTFGSVPVNLLFPRFMLMSSL